MNKETFVAFATQKGGVGKSTVTALVANYVHNVMGYNVAVIDCDEPQHSIAGLRDKETALIEQNDRMRAIACEHFRKSGRKAFPVIRSNAVQALDDAESLLAEGDYKPDIVFFDLPGTLKSDGVIKTLSQMDYIFTPISADRFVVESALQFVMMFNDNLVTTGIARTKYSAPSCRTASASAGICPTTARRCSARPSCLRTTSCCGEAVSRNLPKKSAVSLNPEGHGKPQIEYGRH